MRTAVIDDTKVVNVIEAEEGFELPGFLLVPTDTAGPGWSYVDGEFVAPEPVPVTPVYPQFTALEMLDLFTAEEQLAVVQATLQNAAVKLWYDRLIAATFVTYEDPRTEGGLQALVEAELITPERKAEIVAAMQPETADT